MTYAKQAFSRMFEVMLIYPTFLFLLSISVPGSRGVLEHRLELFNLDLVVQRQSLMVPCITQLKPLQCTTKLSY